ncbi:HIT family protein [Amycolatopsis jejuensis]|uniref:HIT family protein n=1 Tax=Amycolatopsis jejuensis TaxID=330084 RepID=UPI00068DA2B6|nr:HIT family protein [Amycolatopsis jejuensis]
MSGAWPDDWADRIDGSVCAMCRSVRSDEDSYGIRIFSTENVDAVLQRADVQRGYTLVIWRGRHVVEPFELTEPEASSYWQAILTVAKALATFYRPLKMNYETLGNTVPHLHTHLLPRFVDDPAPGRPFPLLPQSGREAQIDPALLASDAAALRALLG